MNPKYFYVLIFIILFGLSSNANAVIYDFGGYISTTQNLSSRYSSLQAGDQFTGTFRYTPLLHSEMDALPSSFNGWFNLKNYSAEVFVSSGHVNIHEYFPILVVDYNSSNNNGPDQVSFIEPFENDHRFYLEDSKGTLISNNFDLTDNFADYGGDFIFCDTVSKIHFQSTYLSAQPIPEPSTFLLIFAGLLGAASIKKRFCN